MSTSTWPGLVILAAATTLTATAAGTAAARPADTPTCSVPRELTGKDLILFGNEPTAPGASGADMLTFVHVTGPDSLRYLIVGAGPRREAHYTYTVSTPGTAILAVQTADPRPVPYTLTLRCRTETTGDYSYSVPGAPTRHPRPDLTAAYRVAPQH
ncbi:hypothetical protein [Nocardia alni]|uniref:hypothetical protein n=1 Tax=Nocardia alni TaxID=2815723 RepID=UPI001C236F94|nr:hypothetical protein [Nocardia alni]